MRRKFKTKSEMYPIVEEFEQSGQTIQQYCVTHCLPKHILNYWLSKHRKEKQKAHLPDFASIEFSPSREDQLIKIVLSSGTEIHIPM